MAQVIFLHGASSSGKSTIAKALQARIERPFWHISIDHMRDAGVLPQPRYQSGEFDWRADRPAFFDGFHASLGAYVSAGNNLILEHILDTEGWLEALRTQFAGHDVLFVGVHCPLDQLIRREAARGDRPEGSAARDFATLHEGRSYDVEVNSPEGVDMNVARILSAWRSGTRTGDFSYAPAV